MTMRRAYRRRAAAQFMIFRVNLREFQLFKSLEIKLRAQGRRSPIAVKVGVKVIAILQPRLTFSLLHADRTFNFFHFPRQLHEILMFPFQEFLRAAHTERKDYVISIAKMYAENWEGGGSYLHHGYVLLYSDILSLRNGRLFREYMNLWCVVVYCNSPTVEMGLRIKDSKWKSMFTLSWNGTRSHSVT